MKEYLFEIVKDPNFLGAFIGALITGLIALSIFWADKRNIKKQKKNEMLLLKSKYWVFYRTKCRQMINLVENIKFYLSLIRGHNSYNIEPIDEIKKNIKELKDNRTSLLANSSDLVPIELYKLIEYISDYIDKMISNFEGTLATEEEESLQMTNLLDQNSQELIDLMKENILNKDFYHFFYITNDRIECDKNGCKN